jgi:hypothetical protein
MDTNLMPDTSLIESDARVVIASADTKILSPQDYERVGAVALGIKKLIKEVVSTFRDPKAKADAAHAAICQAERKFLTPLKDAEARVKRMLANYDEEQEARQRAERRRLEEEAKKQAEAERLADAEAAEDFFGKEAADAVLEAPIVPAAVILPPPAKLEGVRRQENWHAEIVDPKAVLAGIVEGKIPMSAITWNMIFFNAQARMLKSEFNYPGLRAVRERSVGLRA